jgi:uncharacterized damage-inducible protein DinB
MRRTLLLLAAVLPLAAQDATTLITPDEWIGDWKVSKEFTLAVAEKMPAEFYDFKPSPPQMTFGQQMTHIAGSLVFRFKQLTGAEAPFSFQNWPERPDKQTSIRYLDQAFDYVIALLPKITAGQMAKPFKVDWKGRPEVNGRQMMLNMFVHAAHHRAQAEVYLRLKNIEPPAYTF